MLSLCHRPAPRALMGRLIQVPCFRNEESSSLSRGDQGHPQVYTEPGRETGPLLLVCVITSHRGESLTVSSVKSRPRLRGRAQNAFPREACHAPVVEP